MNDVPESWRFIVFGDDWARHPSSSQHLVGGFLGSHRVVWVNSIGMRSPRLRLYDLARIVQRLRNLGQRPAAGVAAATGPLPEVVQPRFLPWHHRSLARRVNRGTIGRQVRSKVPADPAQTTIVWVSNPLAAYLLDHVPCDFLIYYCGDDFTTMKDINHAEVAAREAELLERADLVLCASPALMRSKAPRARGKTAFMPHGVDLSRFPWPPPAPPEAMGAILAEAKPVVGFFGIFADWIDVGLLGQVAERAPDLNFVMLGEPDDRLRALAARLPNVHSLGKVPHQDLAAYAAAFHVGLLLYDADHPFAASINPLKMLEYLALGLPTVSTTAFEGIAGGEELLVARGADAYLAAIRQALALPASHREHLRGIAAANAWSSRQETLRGLLREALAAGREQGGAR